MASAAGGMLEASEIRHFHTTYGDTYGYNERARRFHREYGLVTAPTHPSFAPEFRMQLATAPLFRRDHLGFRREFHAAPAYAFQDVIQRRTEERKARKAAALQATAQLSTAASPPPALAVPPASLSAAAKVTTDNDARRVESVQALAPVPPAAQPNAVASLMPFTAQRPHSELASGRLPYRPFAPPPPRPNFWPVGTANYFVAH
jgi:hypothetical protein